MKKKEKIGNGTLLVTDGDLRYIEFECLNEFADILTHCMSTRTGGFSIGECSSLNLGFNRNDSRENVLRNFQLLCDSAGLDAQSLILTNQVHGSIVRSVDKSDIGKGIFRESNLTGVDGLMTQADDVTMVTFHADCIPVFLVEPGIKAAALLHSGWRGTLKSIVAQALNQMAGLPGFRAERLIAAMGPSIGSCCFEVEEDVYNLFKIKHPNTVFYETVQNGKWKIDLHGIIKSEMIEKGLKEDNIHISGICTKCRNDLFFSYRGDHGKTGSLAAFMQLKQPAVRSNT